MIDRAEHLSRLAAFLRARARIERFRRLFNLPAKTNRVLQMFTRCVAIVVRTIVSANGVLKG